MKTKEIKTWDELNTTFKELTTMRLPLKLKKVHWMVYVNFPFVTIEDVSEIITSLAENPEVKIDEWTAADIASFVMDILGDL